MPRKTKDSKETLEAVENNKKTTRKSTEKKVSTKTKNTTKKEAPKKASTKSATKKNLDVKETSKEKVAKKVKADSKTKKASTSKAKESEKKSTKKATTKKVADKEKVVKKAKKDSKIKKASTSKVKETAKKSTKKTTTKKVADKEKVTKKSTNTKKSTATVKKTTKRNTTKSKIEVLEYYDLPYRYNQTIVKILAQTPNTLFVYWDISDKDKENYIKQYGEYFFNNTKPVLIINNLTKKYTYEIDINDFANSWYLQIEDSMCDYKIELGRRPLNNFVTLPNNYLYVSTSNNIETPNDHILFEKLSNIIYFRNIKTNKTTQKTNLYYLRKLNIQNFYKEMYKDEDFDFDKFVLKNPSSSSSTFK